MLISVIGIDPGETTGLARIKAVRYPTLKETLTEGAEALTTVDIQGSFLTQAEVVATYLLKHEEWCARSGAVGAVVIENFVLRRTGVGGATGNLTSIWVMAAIVGWYRGLGGEMEVAYEMPSAVKSFATDDRLRTWQCWTTGSPHKRDATRCAIVGVNRLIG